MKELFDKISLSIKDTCKEAVDQTQKAVDQTKYRTEIASLKNELKKLYHQLGQAYYRQWTEGEEQKDFSAICKRISSIRRDIEQLEDQVSEVVNIQKSSFENYKGHVKNTWQDQAGYTHKQQYYTNTTQETKSYKFCENCNVGNEIDVEYCVNCGYKF